LRDLLAHFGQLLLIAHHQPKMPCPGRIDFIHLEYGEKLVFTQPEKRVAFAFIELFKVENVCIKGNRFFHVIDLNGNMVTAVNMNAHQNNLDMA